MKIALLPAFVPSYFAADKYFGGASAVSRITFKEREPADDRHSS